METLIKTSGIKSFKLENVFRAGGDSNAIMLELSSGDRWEYIRVNTKNPSHIVDLERLFDPTGKDQIQEETPEGAIDWLDRYLKTKIEVQIYTHTTIHRVKN